MSYLLIVSFPLDTASMRKDTDKVVEIVGKESCGSGAGFGMRDVEFLFDAETDAKAAIRKLAEAPMPASYEVRVHETEF